MARVVRGDRDWPLRWYPLWIRSHRSRRDSCSTISSISAARPAMRFLSHLFSLEPYAMFFDAVMCGRRGFLMQATAKARRPSLQSGGLVRALG
ncbi:hypothetical protein DXZ75_02335 [Streptomyces sp. AcE210]|nr:hypothetical protein DXZ75_02335 [Streptomyces sp. AcE210]